MHGFDFSVPYFITCIRDTSILVTPKIVSDVLRVPRLKFPNYPSCDRLRNVSKDELITRHRIPMDIYDRKNKVRRKIYSKILKKGQQNRARGFVIEL